MPLPQNPAVVNSLLLALFGAGGFWVGNQSQNPGAGADAGSDAPAVHILPGDCWRDARRVFASERESWPSLLSDVVARYGRNRPETEMLAAALMARWSAADPAEAAAKGWPLLHEAAPALVQLMTAPSPNGPSSNGGTPAAWSEAMLRAAGNADHAALERTATQWIAHKRTAAWDFAAAQKDSPHAGVMAMAILQADVTTLHSSGRLEDLRTRLERVFPNGVPAEASFLMVRALAAESPAAAVNFTNNLGTIGSPLREQGSVVLFDALIPLDLALAWNTGNSAAMRRSADFKPWIAEGAVRAQSPSERVAAGFPSRRDLLTLAGVWLELDPHGALTALGGPEVPDSVRPSVVAEALRPEGPALTTEALRRWAERAREGARRAIEPLLK